MVCFSAAAITESAMIDRVWIDKYMNQNYIKSLANVKQVISLKTETDQILLKASKLRWTLWEPLNLDNKWKMSVNCLQVSSRIS